MAAGVDLPRFGAALPLHGLALRGEPTQLDGWQQAPRGIGCSRRVRGV